MRKKWVIYLMNIVQLALELTKPWGKILVNDLFENLVEIWQKKMVKQSATIMQIPVDLDDVHTPLKHSAMLQAMAVKKILKYEFKSSNLYSPSP